MKLTLSSELDLIGQDVTVTDSENKEIVGINGKSHHGNKKYDHFRY